MMQGVEKQIGTLPAIESEAHFFQIGSKVLCGNSVPSSNDAALKQRECGFHSVGVDVSDYVASFAVVDGLVIAPSRLPHGDDVRNVVIGEDNFYILTDILTDVLGESSRFRILRVEEAEIAVALTNANHYFFVVVFCDVALTANLAANVSGIHFHFPIQHGFIGLRHCVPDAMAQIPRRLVTADSESALNLASGHALLRLTEQERCGEPLHKRQVGIVEYRSSGNGELVVAILAVEQLLLGFEFDHGAFAAQAAGAFREAQARQKLAALLFGREHGVDVN